MADSSGKAPGVVESTNHTQIEDVLALLIGTLFVSFGIALFKHVGLLTGSTAGIAFLIHYVYGLVRSSL